MVDPNAPRPLFNVTFDFIPVTINALFKFMPYIIVLYAIWSANHGASEKIWTPILVAGAALIEPPKSSGGGGNAG